MNKFTLRLLTALLLGVSSIALIAFDYWMSWACNDATISKTFLWLSAHAPVTIMVVCFWFGVLTGHLFLPQIPLSKDDQ